jgi:hypothetical protein
MFTAVVLKRWSKPAAALLGTILEMQILGPYARPESETGIRTQQLFQ